MKSTMWVKTPAIKALAGKSPINELALDLFGEDTLGLIIRSHAYLDSALVARLTSTWVVKKQVFPQISFLAKGSLAIGHGFINADLENPLVCVNIFRNRFAHRLDSTLVAKDVETLSVAMPPRLNLKLSGRVSTRPRHEIDFLTFVMLIYQEIKSAIPSSTEAADFVGDAEIMFAAQA